MPCTESIEVNTEIRKKHTV